MDRDCEEESAAAAIPPSADIVLLSTQRADRRSGPDTTTPASSHKIHLRHLQEGMFADFILVAAFVTC